jgi:hypothetical protein
VEDPVETVVVVEAVDETFDEVGQETVVDMVIQGVESSPSVQAWKTRRFPTAASPQWLLEPVPGHRGLVPVPEDHNPCPRGPLKI